MKNKLITLLVLITLGILAFGAVSASAATYGDLTYSVSGCQKIFITIPDYLPENARIILACYKNGELTEIQSTLNKNETIYFVTSEEFDAAKVMAWESLGNMIPLCEAETVL